MSALSIEYVVLTCRCAVSDLEYHLEVDEVCESYKDDSSIFMAEIIRKQKGKEKVGEDYQQEEYTSEEHGSITPETKRKRLGESDGSGEDSVDCSVGKSTRRLKHSGGIIFLLMYLLLCVCLWFQCCSLLENSDRKVQFYRS